MKLLHYHKQLFDGAIAPLFNVYFQKLRGLYERGTRWFHKYDVAQYWSADLRINNEDLHVTLWPRDRAYFEFFTTGNPIVSGTVVQSGITLSSVKAACVGVEVTLDKGAISAVPRIRTGARSFSGQDISLVERAFQVQLIDEPVTALPDPPATVFGRPKYLRTLYESFAPGHSHTGVHTRSYSHGRTDNSLANAQFTGVILGARGASSSHNLRDVLFDVPFQDGQKARPVRDAVINDGVVDWPRANGIQKVKNDIFGDREFAIYIDAFSQVTVFPTSRIMATNGDVQNVLPLYVKTVPAGMPGWVFQMSERFATWYDVNGTTGIAEFPENDWKIHPDGTRACSVVYKRQQVDFDEAYWGTATPPISAVNFGTYTSTYTGEQARQGTVISGTSNQRYAVATGLLELTISISITGEKDENYTLIVTCDVIRDPEVTEFCTLFAGYTYYDVPDPERNAVLLAARGDLCVWDIERYYRYPERTTSILATVFGPAVGTTEDLARSFISTSDYERNMTLGALELGFVPDTTYNPDIVSLIGDVRRVLYSLKNLTRDTELRTHPGMPSGVCKPYRVDIAAIAPYASHPLIVTPIQARAQFSRVDMTTLSYVLLYQVGTQDARIVNTNLNSPAVHGNPALMYFAFGVFNVLHPACAVYTFCQLREVLYPETMPDVYSQPSPVLYSEPQQQRLKDRLADAAAEDFRATHMQADTDGQWTMVSLAGGPPGKTAFTDWTDTDMTLLRYWITFNEGTVQMISPTIPTIPIYPVGALSTWWAAMSPYTGQLGQVLLKNPRFHWQMYSDCIINALMWTPWSTFFVHPNGTWAFYDQSRIYNQDGIPLTEFGGARSVGEDYNLNYSEHVDPTQWEHCIFDRVHLQFTLSDGKSGGKSYAKDTTFVELYNTAVQIGTEDKTIPMSEIFNFITPEVLKAKLLKLPDGTLSVNGLTLQLDWTGDTVTYQFGDNGVYFGAGVAFGGGGGTIDLSLDYAWGSLSPQAGSQRITFSSCLLVETL